jgi:thymidylate kinase
MMQEHVDELILDRALARRKSTGRTVVFGLCGAQGSGKSTTAGRLAEKLNAAGCRTVVLSIDDFYLTRAERQETARSVHPLDDKALRRFIAHFERITRWVLRDEPADIVIELNPDRTPARVR